MSTRDIDVLLDRYANALVLHKGDRHAVEECEDCQVVRAEIVARDRRHASRIAELEHFLLEPQVGDCIETTRRRVPR